MKSTARTFDSVRLAGCLLAALSMCEVTAAQSSLPPDLEADIADLVETFPAQMRVIPTGVLQMGDLAVDGPSNERPVRSVSLRAYRLGKYEVTFDQYDVFARATGRALPDDWGWGRGNRPVTNVSWEDARAFAGWLSEVSGREYRLPTEAEWEYAARGGSATELPWDATVSPSQANVDGTTGGDTFEYTAPVGSFPANSWDLHDMIGNVWEWTADCWNDSYAGAPTDGSAWPAGECFRRVVRGGSWGTDASSLRASSRGFNDATDRYGDLGFRLAQDL